MPENTAQNIELKPLEDGSVEVHGMQDANPPPEEESTPPEPQISADPSEDDEPEDRTTRNREERRRRKDIQQRARERNKEKINEQAEQIRRLEEQVAQLQKGQRDITVGNLDNQITAQEDLIHRIKGHLETVEDRKIHTELVERLADEKSRLKEMRQAREQEERQRTKTSSHDAVATRLARQWIDENDWYDPEGRDRDSRRVLRIDKEMIAEGYKPNSPHYWEELTERVQEELPHLFEKKRSPPIASSRNDSVAPKPPSTEQKGWVLSKIRKEAMIEEGIWDDPVKRERRIRYYKMHDQEEALNNARS